MMIQILASRMLKLLFALSCVTVCAWPQQTPPQTQPKASSKSPFDQPPPSGPTPKMPNGKPDFSGVWNPGLGFATLGQVSLQPWADALY